VVTELLSNLVARGLRADASMLFVIDGGKPSLLRQVQRAAGHSPALDLVGGVEALIFPRRRGQHDYAASAAVWDLNSNSIGLT
jgi:hypothetical protein